MPEAALLARFVRPASALSCWAHLRLVAGNLDASSAIEVRRDPDGLLWLLASVTAEVGAGIVWAAGGEPYAAWPPIAIASSNPYPAPDEAMYATYQAVAVIEMLACLPVQLRPSAAAKRELVLLLNGPFANHVIRRSIGAGAEVYYQPVSAMRMYPEGGRTGPAVLVRIVNATGLPRSLVRTLTRLPQVIVGEALDPAQRLIVAVDHRLPVAAEEVVPAIAADERWVLGGAEGGAWSVRGSRTTWFSADELYSTPGLVAAAALPEKRSALVPKGIPIRLVRDAERGGRPEAVVVGESELDLLRTYLTGRPLGETGYLTPGPGGFLVQEPGGLVNDLPFGVPLRRIGPGGLFVPDGYRLHPAIPASGRRTLFALAPGVAVVVNDGQVRRFELASAVPMWSLWAAELPAVRTQVAGRVAEILRRMDELLPVRPPVPGPISDTELAGAQRDELHRSALIAENDDDPIRAAGLLQQAGDFAAAARLLEAAALGRRSS